MASRKHDERSAQAGRAAARTSAGCGRRSPRVGGPRRVRRRARRRGHGGHARRVRPQPGERVLELACGPGGPAWRPPTRRAGRRGRALRCRRRDDGDRGFARRRARTRQRAHAASSTSSRSTQPDGSYDVVVCREGLMFAPDPAGRRARSGASSGRAGGLRSPCGGRGSATRGSALVFDAVSAQTGRPVPPPGVPGPFSLGDREQLIALLAAGGLTAIRVTEQPTPLRAGSFDEWWSRTSALAGPAGESSWAALPEEAVAALRTRLQEAVSTLYDARRASRSPASTLNRLGPAGERRSRTGSARASRARPRGPACQTPEWRKPWLRGRATGERARFSAASAAKLPPMELTAARVAAFSDDRAAATPPAWSSGPVARPRL